MSFILIFPLFAIVMTLGALADPDVLGSSWLTHALYQTGGITALIFLSLSAFMAITFRFVDEHERKRQMEHEKEVKH